MNGASRDLDQVTAKADRLRRERLRQPGVWRYAQLVGAAGWVFVLPVVAAAFLARIVVEATGRPSLGLSLIGLGVGLGAWAAARQLWRLLHDDNTDAERVP